MKFAQQFSRPGKSLENKWEKVLSFFFQSYGKCFRSETFSVLVKSYSFSRVFAAHHAKSFVWLHFFMSPFITYLITFNLEKEIIVLEKSLEKVLNFGSKNLYEPWNGMAFSYRESNMKYCKCGIFMFFAKSCAYKYAQVFSLCMHVLVSTYTQINIWHFVICTAIGFDVFTILVNTDG